MTRRVFLPGWMRAWILLCVWLCAGGPSWAHPLEERLFADAANGHFDRLTLLEAALVASGVDDPADLTRYRAQVAGRVEDLRRSGTVCGTPRQQAQAIFEFLHRRILTGGYRLECTDLRHALDHGRFNCVSATVLFNCLAGEFGLKVCGLETPGHAMSRLQTPDAPLDIETTCPRWFQLLDRPQKQAELVEKTLGRLPAKDRPASRPGTVPAFAQRKRDCPLPREISAVELMAMIYYNRGVDLLGEKRFPEAAAANAKSMRLDPSNATARGNFLATLNNWAIDLGTSGRYGEAAELLASGLQIDPTYEAFGLNYVHVYRQWTAHLCAAGEFDQALGLLARAAAQRPSETYFLRAQSEISRRQALANDKPSPGHE